MSTLRPFHLAILVNDLAAARDFYGGLLGCAEGRSDTDWVDFDLYGHQLVCHLGLETPRTVSNEVDHDHVPVPHFGVVLDAVDWVALAGRLDAAGHGFILEPTVRFAGEPGEQSTFFVADPAGNVLEFKSMADPDRLFSA